MALHDALAYGGQSYSARDPGEGVERNRQLDTEFVSLSNASYFVYHKLMGMDVYFRNLEEFNSVLAEVARALANVAPIYSQEPESGTYRQLDAVDLLFGVFQRGASVLRTSYADYAHLAIRRKDMTAAVPILRGAGIRFALPLERT
jgi:hypothetical protein